MKKFRMKGGREIAEVEALAARTAFPAYNGGFQSYYGRLRDLVAQNFGYHVVDKSFDYDDDKQCFFFQVRPAISIFRVGNTRFIAEMPVTIDPTLPLAPQFALAQEKFEAMTKHFYFAFGAFIKGVESGEIKEEVE